MDDHQAIELPPLSTYRQRKAIEAYEEAQEIMNPESVQIAHMVIRKSIDAKVGIENHPRFRGAAFFGRSSEPNEPIHAIRYARLKWFAAFETVRVRRPRLFDSREHSAADNELAFFSLYVIKETIEHLLFSGEDKAILGGPVAQVQITDHKDVMGGVYYLMLPRTHGIINLSPSFLLIQRVATMMTGTPL